MKKNPRPNILWICSDQQRWNTLGCYGNSFVRTPNLDALAREGVLFSHAYCQNPLCQPSRASFLTGRYPSTTGLRQNGQDFPEEETRFLLPRMLSDHRYGDRPYGEQYFCGLAGKFHLGACNHRFLFPDGGEGLSKGILNVAMERRYDDGYSEFHWDHAPSGKLQASAYTQWLRARERGVTRQKLETCPYVVKGTPSDDHQATFCAEKAIHFMQARAKAEDGRPWLFSVNIFDPHPGYDPPADFLQRYFDQYGPELEGLPEPAYEQISRADKPSYQERFQGPLPGAGRRNANGSGSRTGFTDMTPFDHRCAQAAYFAMVDHLDVQIGRMLTALEETGQRENTIVIFMSDHGEMDGSHGHYAKGPFLYDTAVRVPFMIAGPGIQRGVVTDAMIELTDIVPTLLDGVGLPRHEGIQGESFWDLLAGKAPADRFRESVFVEYFNSNPHMFDTRSKDGRIFLSSVRTARFKLIRCHSAPPGTVGGELYDMEADPQEQKNLWEDPDFREDRLAMMELLSNRLAMLADPLPERIGIF